MVSAGERAAGCLHASPGSVPGVSTALPATAFRPLLDVLHRLQNFDVRLGGGWGVDVLVGQTTRSHHDVDLFVPVDRVEGAIGELAGDGFQVVLGEAPWRVVMAGPGGERVDLNGLVYRADGHATQTDDGGDLEVFPAWGWTDRTIADRRVVCLTAELQRLKHRGYSSRPVDQADLAALAHLVEPPIFDPSIRPVDPSEVDLIPAIERASDRLLEAFWGQPLPPEEPDPDLDPTPAASTSGPPTLVAGRPPVGFARLELVDGHTHLGQVSVLAEYGQQGIGTSLVEASCDWARGRGDQLITLTTFAAVPFNAPWYRRLGFRELSPPPGSGLARIATRERALERLGIRLVMARVLGNHRSAKESRHG